ncbi:MAG: toxin-antitoxin system [Candidatus Competibacteraceae bacterium]|nr:toxin-antitoxin system [Candidatus Competibacteraceae bacterium]MCB1770749.1 toxin-antitoxin system [Candidatus Competibacteraceae bacterium]MCP5125955.1 toxin-antitoxin system [Gammaproteobacteria bacterium]
MAQVTIRHLQEEVEIRLRQRATLHGCSVEEEIQRILHDAVKEEIPLQKGLGSRIAARFAQSGLTDDLPELHGQILYPIDFAP